MFVQSLVVPRPRWEDIEGAIRNLDGTLKDTITLESDWTGGPRMDVSGDGMRFTVIVTRRGNQFVLTDPTTGDDMIDIRLAGGEVSEWPRCQTTDAAGALTAAKTFAESGELDPSFQWEKQ